jgi:hypothetical protein
MTKINALFVETDGVYFNQENIIPWDIEKNAFDCKNNLKAICHPPCKRWGRYWSGGPSVKVKKLMGDDNQSFAFCLWYVRTFGGIIEHPQGSHAWNYYGLKKPKHGQGWIEADSYGGYTCSVYQGNYGHKAPKPTWLYINKVNKKELDWSRPENKLKVEESPHSKEEAMAIRNDPNYKPKKRISEKERMDTPIEFRDLLVSMIND